MSAGEKGVSVGGKGVMEGASVGGSGVLVGVNVGRGGDVGVWLGVELGVQVEKIVGVSEGVLVGASDVDVKLGGIVWVRDEVGDGEDTVGDLGLSVAVGCDVRSFDMRTRNTPTQ